MSDKDLVIRKIDRPSILKLRAYEQRMIDYNLSLKPPIQPTVFDIYEFFDGENPVGFIMGYGFSSAYFLQNIFLDEEFRGQGLASAFLHQFEDEFRKANIKAIFTSTFSQQKALSFWAKNNYLVVSEAALDSGESYYLLRKDL
jgi:GNAT superfamily N-acetyltransferase